MFFCVELFLRHYSSIPCELRPLPLTRGLIVRPFPRERVRWSSNKHLVSN